MKKNTVLLLTSLFISPLVQASNSVEVHIPEQTWQYEIKYGLLGHETARLNINEQALSKKLKPLLMAQNYEQAWQVLKNVKHSDSSAALLQTKGQVALQVNQTSDAEAALLAALNKRPDLVPSHRALASIYLQADKLSLAQTHLTHALALGDQNATVFAQLAYLHMQTSAPYSAIAGFRHALFLDPNNEGYKKGLLWALQQSGDLGSAHALVQQMLNTHPNDANLWLNLANIEMAQSQFKQALSSMDIAHRLGEKSPQNILLTAQLHLQYGNKNKGVKLLGELVTLTKGEHVSHVLTALSAIIGQPNPIKINNVLGYIDQQSDSLSAKQTSTFYTLKGQVAQQGKQNQSAIKYFRRALKADANNGQALIALGKLYFEDKQLGQANIYFSRASAIEQYQEQAWLYRAQIAVAQGQYELAIGLLNKAYKHNPTRRDLLANIKQLERVQRTL